jgi:hypothetical protein
VRAKSYSTDEYAAEIEEQRTFASVEIVPADNSDGQAVDGLTPMRDWMADRSDVVICIGGAWWDINKVKAGVPNELDAMLDLGKPGFVVAGFSGAIAGYLEEDPSLLSRLRNGLCHETNATIANSTSVDLVVKLIADQLKNLPPYSAYFLAWP